MKNDWIMRERHLCNPPLASLADCRCEFFAESISRNTDSTWRPQGFGWILMPIRRSMCGICELIHAATRTTLGELKWFKSGASYFAR